MVLLPVIGQAKYLTKRDTIYFNSDSYTLTAEHKEQLRFKANWMKHDVQKVIIEGYTDSDGSEEYNIELSKKRANAVADYFKLFDFKEGLISQVSGYGEANPIAKNTTEEGKAKNRRVVITYNYTPTPIEEEQPKPEASTVIRRGEKTYHEVIGKVYDAETGELLKAFIVVKHNGGMIVAFNNKESVTVRTEIGLDYEIHVTDEGYETKIVPLSVTDTTKTFTIRLKKLKYSKKLTFENINFVGNQATFLPESYDELEQLLKTMQDNPEIKIEIHGHVNGPYSKMSPKPDYISPMETPWYYELSLARAKAVYSYLAEHGISTDRMTYKGLGNSEMLYPYATSENEQKLNRRVEVYILEE